MAQPSARAGSAAAAVSTNAWMLAEAGTLPSRNSSASTKPVSAHVTTKGW